MHGIRLAAAFLLGGMAGLASAADTPVNPAPASAPASAPATTAPLPAAPPLIWALDKAFSADEQITMKNGLSVAGRAYVDGGKISSQLDMNGMTATVIVRPDEKKVFVFVPEQKLLMEGPLGADKLKQLSAVASGADAKYENVGSEVVDGVPCTKVKITITADGKVYFGWMNAATRVPVRLAAADGSLTVSLKNYLAGPQAAGLFEPPTGYQAVPLPAGFGLPAATAAP